MDKSSVYYEQVKLLIRMLPTVAKEKVFALKGGTAINLFIHDFPRLSVDIDLAYLPIDARDEALVNARSALQRITDNINAQPDVSAVLQDNKSDELRIVVSSRVATIKIEVSPVARGTLHRPSNRQISEFVEDEFGFAEIPVVSLPDLYGGKICAAMDRQHPRDLFDVRLLLDEQGITREILVGFLTYTLSHPRPINEVMSPNWQPLDEKFHDEFKGMTREPVALAVLEATRSELVAALKAKFTSRDRDFLLSFKRGEPDWFLFDEIAAAELPAIRWKLINIQELMKNEKKHQEQLAKLEGVLEEWLTVD